MKTKEINQQPTSAAPYFKKIADWQSKNPLHRVVFGMSVETDKDGVPVKNNVTIAGHMSLVALLLATIMDNDSHIEDVVRASIEILGKMRNEIADIDQQPKAQA